MSTTQLLERAVLREDQQGEVQSGLGLGWVQSGFSLGWSILCRHVNPFNRKYEGPYNSA